MITKRRELHLVGAPAASMAPFRPRLRIEPCPTFYLRTARAYTYLRNLLLATAGEERLGQLHGLREDGKFELPLADELENMRMRFYGLYLIGCQDIGMKPRLRDDELSDMDAIRSSTLDWLSNIADDPDLSRDVRVVIPIYYVHMASR